MKMMKKYIGSAYTIPLFVTFLTGLFLRDPSTDKEKQDAQAGHYDPMDQYSPTSGVLNDIYNGKNRRGGATTIRPNIAQELLNKLDDEKFSNEVSSLPYSVQDSMVADIESYGFKCEKSELIDVCFEIYKALLEAAAAHRLNVTPGDIGREGGISDEDHWLLTEVKEHCPICQAQLVKKRRGKTLKKYKIVKIYPDSLPSSLKASFDAIAVAPADLDSVDNKIALCDDDADDYLNYPSAEMYGKLVQIKKKLIDNKNLMDELDSIQLKQELDTVLTEVKNVTNGTILRDLEMDALTLPDKIPNDIGLLSRVQGLAVHYYYFIQDRLQELEDAGDIRISLVMAEVRNAYEELHSHHLSQEEIFNRLVSWLLYKMNLPQDQYETAGEIVVAYFIQDCEVFSLETAE